MKIRITTYQIDGGFCSEVRSLETGELINWDCHRIMEFSKGKAIAGARREMVRSNQEVTR